MENRIKERIKQSGMMQKDVAERLGITTVGLSKMTTSPTLKFDTFRKVADVLGIPAWKLFLSDTEIREIRDEGIREETTAKFQCPECGCEFRIVPLMKTNKTQTK